MPPVVAAATAAGGGGGGGAVEMTLVVSNLVIGFDTVPPGATWYDSTDTYRTEGPLVSLLWSRRSEGWWEVAAPTLR
ncbi:hypothetical protein HXX76_011566 [Chlamydomonas incerta]|uniref:Uncharacterized protein n=1 Tax=Chlamydomonas incerta TaxID=51695 RepID=A0A835SMS1_CHLIN|nr:hypothetical protein HXX76_011566 [Chlamydomonas incerta]|eukprot:KAG2428446.1 hypothetical protein HXX76_011566 [Chlamydomonas incerta]